MIKMGRERERVVVAGILKCTKFQMKRRVYSGNGVSPTVTTRGDIIRIIEER